MKQITFSKNLIKKAETRALEVGLTFNEYVRHLVVNDIEQAIELLTEESERAVAQSLNDLSEGKYTVLNNSKEIKKHFKKLLKR